jgi:hypothetical protein
MHALMHTDTHFYSHTHALYNTTPLTETARTELYELWSAWFERMPLRADAVESQRASLQLCRMLATAETEPLRYLLGPQLQRLPQALEVLAEAVQTPFGESLCCVSTAFQFLSII